METSMIYDNHDHDHRNGTFCESEVSIGSYLGARLKSIGVSHFFMVPGDYTLNLLDEMLNIQGLTAVPCCNELNAGYAADGFARCSGKMGVLVVTYMVGALSSINAVAGAFAENLPLLIVVGCPNSHEARTAHHSISDIDRSMCRNTLQHVVHDTFHISNRAHAQMRIDDSISSCLRHRKPVYLEICCNLATEQVMGIMPIGSLLNLQGGVSDCTSLNHVLDTVIPVISRAKKMIVLAGSNIMACESIEHFRQLVDRLKCATAHLPDGKGILDETSENFMGCFWGSVSIPPIQDLVDGADLILVVGPYFSDYVNVGWSIQYPAHKTVIVAKDHVHFNHQRFSFVNMSDVLGELRSRCEQKENPFKDAYRVIHDSYFDRERKFEDLQHHLDLAFLVAELQLFVNHCGKLNERFDVVAETGDCWFIGQRLRLPSNSAYFVQMQYGSIGWSLPASLGIGLWHQKTFGFNGSYRILLLIGDGSFQVSLQALSTLIKNNINVTILLMNNQSYAIEDQIHQAAYNKLVNWKYADLVEVMSGTAVPCRGMKVESRESFRKALVEAAHSVGVVFIECVVDKDDCTDELRKWAECTAEANARLG